MDILFLLVPLSVVLVLGIVALFYWSLQTGQFDDIEARGNATLEDGDGSCQPQLPEGTPDSRKAAPALDSRRD